MRKPASVRPSRPVTESPQPNAGHGGPAVASPLLPDPAGSEFTRRPTKAGVFVFVGATSVATRHYRESFVATEVASTAFRHSRNMLGERLNTPRTPRGSRCPFVGWVSSINPARAAFDKRRWVGEANPAYEAIRLLVPKFSQYTGTRIIKLHLKRLPSTRGAEALVIMVHDRERFPPVVTVCLDY